MSRSLKNISGSEILRGKKATLRYMIDNKVRGLTHEERNLADEKIVNTLITMKRYITSKNIMVYYPFGREPDIRKLVAHARLDGKRIFLPRCETQINMSVVRWEDDAQDMAPDAKGMMTPVDAERIDARDLDMVLVPGVGFDMRGGRMGRGGGYYDRFLSGIECPVKRVGLCYDCQLVTGLPLGPHDVMMHAVVTELGMIEQGCGC